MREADIDEGRLNRVMFTLASKRLRSWANVSVELDGVWLGYKAIDVFDAAFSEGHRTQILVDGMTGGYALGRHMPAGQDTSEPTAFGV